MTRFTAISIGLILFLCVVTTLSMAGERLKIGIYNSYGLFSATFTPKTGNYVVYAGKMKVTAITTHDIIKLTAENGQIRIRKNNISMGVYNSLTFKANTSSTIAISPNNNGKIKIFHDNIVALRQNGKLKLINEVDLEEYIADVVEAEAGNGVDSMEFYKAHAIISRTYALKNKDKHSKEGFHLCDEVHCQVYKGVTKSSKIINATKSTEGIVIVDTAGKLISPTFYSNCGGETANSEDVWTMPYPYLKSIKDPFCEGMPQSKWEKRIPTSTWLSYLEKKYNYPIQDSDMVHYAMNFSQYGHRKSELTPYIPLTEIRKDFKLKSTFFSIIPEGDTLLFKGRGFGHGVGLCQEGSMKRAEKGQNYKTIITAYFTGVSFTNYNQITTPIAIVSTTSEIDSLLQSIETTTEPIDSSGYFLVPESNAPKEIKRPESLQKSPLVVKLLESMKQVEQDSTQQTTPPVPPIEQHNTNTEESEILIKKE